jgi:hypothetical protein
LGEVALHGKSTLSHQEPTAICWSMSRLDRSLGCSINVANAGRVLL